MLADVRHEAENRRVEFENVPKKTLAARNVPIDLERSRYRLIKFTGQSGAMNVWRNSTCLGVRFVRIVAELRPRTRMLFSGVRIMGTCCQELGLTWTSPRKFPWLASTRRRCSSSWLLRSLDVLLGRCWAFSRKLLVGLLAIRWLV